MPAPCNSSCAISAHVPSDSTRSRSATRAEQCHTYPRLPDRSSGDDRVVGKPATTAGASNAAINGFKRKSNSPGPGTLRLPPRRPARPSWPRPVDTDAPPRGRGPSDRHSNPPGRQPCTTFVITTAAEQPAGQPTRSFDPDGRAHRRSRSAGPACCHRSSTTGTPQSWWPNPRIGLRPARSAGAATHGQAPARKPEADAPSCRSRRALPAKHPEQASPPQPVGRRRRARPR